MLTCLSWDLQLDGRFGRVALVILRHHAYDVWILWGVSISPQVPAAPLPLGALHDELRLPEALIYQRVNDIRLRIACVSGLWNY